MKTKLIFLLALVLFLPIFVYAGSATVSWGANTESDLKGYKVYYGTSPRSGTCPPGNYTNNIDVGKVTSYTFNNLTSGKTYYFSVTAYDTSGNESACSAQVSKLIQGIAADFNNDGKVNIFDLAVFAANWNISNPANGDFNNDGIVNVFDLAQFASQWTG
jgi:hypothetical protein